MPPRERQKLQQRTPSALGNVSDRYYREGNVEGMKNINQELQNRIKNHPVLQPGTGYLTGPGSYWNVGLRSGDNTGIISAAMADNRTSINPNTWHQSPYFGIAGYDFVKNRAPEYLDFFQDIKDKDAMARDTNYQVTLPEHEKLGKLSGYQLLPEGVYPYANPSWIENNPSYGLDYMADLWGGKGRVGFRKGLDDDEWNAYANWGIEF